MKGEVLYNHELIELHNLNIPGRFVFTVWGEVMYNHELIELHNLNIPDQYEELFIGEICL